MGKNSRGVSLVEVMVTTVILTVVGLGIVSSFGYIARSVQSSRNKTLAINLSQEQVEAIKNKSYFNILPTSTPTYNASFSPAIPYDTAYYPASTIRINTIAFQRLTYIERVVNSGGSLTAAPWDGLDTGLKRITVTTIWQLGGYWYKVSVTNLAANSEQSASGEFQGTVTEPGGAPISGANVFVQNNPFFYGLTDSSGRYAFAVTPNNYTLAAAAPGYSRQTSSLYAASAGNSVTVDFTLTPISSGSVSGAAYLNSHLLVSQVVSSSSTRVGDLSTRDVEYVELFNPTTASINIGSGSTRYVQLNYKGQSSSDNSANIPLTYVSTYAAPGKYYLISNATSFLILGSWVTSDAYYALPYNLFDDIIKKNKAGAVQIADSAGTVIDGAGWSNSASGASAPWSEGTAIVQTGGLQEGDQLVRMSSISALSSTYGRAYDSDDNATNFGYRGQILTTGGLSYAPFGMSNSSQSVISGTPAYGAVVTANDGLSASTSAYRITASGFAYATFTLVGIATGTWTVNIASGSAFLAISSVSVLTQGADTAIPNSATSPTWPVSNLYSSVLSSTTSNGTVTGTVTDALGAALSGITVNVEPSGSGLTNSSGFYSISVPAGTYSVIANPNSTNQNYTSATVSSLTVSAGQTNNGNNFILSGSGGMTGYVCNTSASNVYPGLTVAVYDSDDNLRAQVVTNSNGRFTVASLSTGTYTVKPVLDDSQSSSPAAVVATTASGTSLSVGTFTISGAYGVISGSATLAGSNALITTGVLVVATTSTISGSLPPAISTGTLSSIPYYMASSLADGTFSLSVRASTASATFNLYGWYTTFSGSTPAITKKTVSGVVVTGGQTTSRGIQW